MTSRIGIQLEAIRINSDKEKERKNTEITHSGLPQMNEDAMSKKETPTRERRHR